MPPTPDCIFCKIASGEIPAKSVLRLGFKQGNINAYLGNDLELQKEWEEKIVDLAQNH